MDTGFLLDVLACPKCHGNLEFLENNGKDSGFLCRKCGLVYPVENEIPVMLVEKSIPQNEFMQLREKA